MDKQIDAIVYDTSEHIAVNKLRKLINMVLEDEKMLTPKMKDSMMIVNKYIPKDHLIQTFEEYDKKYVEQIKHLSERVKLLSGMLKMLSEKKGGAVIARQQGAAKKKKPVQKKKSIQKKKKSIKKKKKSIQKKKK